MAVGANGALAPARGRRPSNLEKIPPEVRAEIVDRIRKGAPGERAAGSCGVPRRTFQRWLEKGRAENGREPYRSFAAEVDRAFDEFVVNSVVAMDEGAKKDWRAALEMLKRRDPENWADPDRAVATQVNVQVVEAERSDLSARLLAAAQRCMGDDPELLARFMAEVAGGEVVVGEAAEVAELAP